ncbi:hypothetical protein POM88_052369 [Heracleum sosnowskyi]|uniref:AAA ATPase AAA+ lid domain-containing protein n=1 Tax=Heracleum sosnowskyi TaxID=360622 RepID=A0AAD8GS45_9APIA|nr:hypothetical protein POM88_052369 [Heracleum sosnowskyi]
MTLAEDVNLEDFVMTKYEFSGADIKEICTQAGLLALRECRIKVQDEDDVVSCDDDVYAPSEVSKWKEDAGLMETPSGRSGGDIAILGVLRIQKEKKIETSSRSNMDHLSAFGSVPLQHACPPWASPSLGPSGFRTPSTVATDLFKDRVTSTIGGSSFPSAQKRGTLSARSGSIQDEVRKVRSRAAEDMLHALPSKRNDLLVSGHRTSENSIVPGGGSTVDKMHLSKSLPEKEHVGPSTIHDSKDSFALGLKQDGVQAEPQSSNPSASVYEPNQVTTAAAFFLALSSALCSSISKACICIYCSSPSPRSEVLVPPCDNPGALCQLAKTVMLDRLHLAFASHLSCSFIHPFDFVLLDFYIRLAISPHATMPNYAI